MKVFLLSLTGIVLGAAALHSTTADPAASPHSKRGDELHAAVTDMPDIVDMSYADPKTWHRLPAATQVYDTLAPEKRGVPQLNPAIALKVLLR